MKFETEVKIRVNDYVKVIDSTTEHVYNTRNWIVRVGTIHLISLLRKIRNEVSFPLSVYYKQMENKFNVRSIETHDSKYYESYQKVYDELNYLYYFTEI